ncbi:hypothetical protein FQZ97_1110460 [compost metagenome]
MGLQRQATLQHGFGLGQQLAAGPGQRRIAAAAVEQRHAEVDLQVGHRRTDRGLGLAQAPRGSGKGACLNHQCEYLQLVQRKTHGHPPATHRLDR